MKRVLTGLLAFALAVQLGAQSMYAPGSGAPGATGPTGSNGAAGATGATGATGSGGSSVVPWLTATFGGDGSDGAYAPVGSANLDTGTLKQYSSVSLDASEIVTCTEANGICRIAVSGNLTFAAGAGFDANGKGIVGQPGSTAAPGNYSYPVLTAATLLGPTFLCSRSGGGGGGGARVTAGTSRAGGGSLGPQSYWDAVFTSTGGGGSGIAIDGNGNAGSSPSAFALSAYGSDIRSTRPPDAFLRGNGGGGGGAAKNNSVDEGEGGDGGASGGIWVIEVAGTCTFASGSIFQAKGAAGTGGTGTVVTAGAGGGGGGGIAVMRCGTIVDSGLVTSVAGGAGGTSAAGSSFTGGAGGNGSAGYSYVGDVVP